MRKRTTLGGQICVIYLIYFDIEEAYLFNNIKLSHNAVSVKSYVEFAYRRSKSTVLVDYLVKTSIGLNISQRLEKAYQNHLQDPVLFGRIIHLTVEKMSDNCRNAADS